MENPLDLDVPLEQMKRIRDYARDLAWGALNGEWDSLITVDSNGRSTHDPVNFSEIEDINDLTSNQIKFIEKWVNKNPSIGLLVSFKYLTKSGERGQKLLSLGRGMVYSANDPIPVDFEIEYFLTDNAFNLLEKPPTTTSAFISYKRESSSAVALLVEAKLKMRDNGIEIFVDKLIKPGDDWAQNIQEKIKQSRYFICLLAPDTYTESEWVRKELEWAYDAGCEIISVFHDGAVLNDRYPVWLGKKQIIKVDFETAKHYESALDEILVGLGYSTY